MLTPSQVDDALAARDHPTVWHSDGARHRRNNASRRQQSFRKLHRRDSTIGERRAATAGGRATVSAT